VVSSPGFEFRGGVGPPRGPQDIKKSTLLLLANYALTPRPNIRFP
jgi:hypothetical protein